MHTDSTARQIAAPSVPKHVITYKEVPFGGLVDTLQFWVILGENHQFRGPEIGNPVIKKFARNSKTVRDREKVTIDHL